MANHKSLEQTLLEDIQKTGYPTEIVSASVMQQRGWGIIHNPSYLDDREGRSREFDIRAFRSWSFQTAGRRFIIDVLLLVECKKSEKPWVFFITPEDHGSPRLGTVIKNHISNRKIFTNRHHGSAECAISDEVLRTFHHYFQKRHLARTFYEPLKSQERADHSQMIYSAVLSCVKATIFHYKDQPSENRLTIYYPVIIFSGNLYEAEVASDKTVNLAHSQHVQLSFNYMLPAPSRTSSVWEGHQRFIVDIVHEDYLGHFLTTIEDEHSDLTQRLRDTFDGKSGPA